MESRQQIEHTPHRQKYRWPADLEINLPAISLRAAIEKLLAARQLLERFRESVHFHARMEASSAPSLTITRCERQITVGHFFSCDGETLADPAMDLEFGKDGAWYPISLELATGDCRQCVDGPFRIDFGERKKLVAFSALWSADLLEQGYERGEISQLWAENE